jgi:hypothetical protein
MRRVSVICAAAVSCLAFGVFANASAEASVFSFSFGSGVTGTFVTADDAASDPGYQPILTLTFSQLQGELSDGTPFFVSDVAGSGFAPGAAFNPTTRAFINDLNVHNLGDFDISADPRTPMSFINCGSFSQHSSNLTGAFRGTFFIVDAPLVISPLAIPSVPEASTWAMMLLGFAGLGFAGYRAKAGHATLVAPTLR